MPESLSADDAGRFAIDDDTAVERDGAKNRALRHLRPIRNGTDSSVQAFAEAYFKAVGADPDGYALPSKMLVFSEQPEGSWFEWLPMRPKLKSSDGTVVRAVVCKQVQCIILDSAGSKIPIKLDIRGAGLRVIVRSDVEDKDPANALIVSSSSTAVDLSSRSIVVPLLEVDTLSHLENIALALIAENYVADGAAKTERFASVGPTGSIERVAVAVEQRLAPKIRDASGGASSGAPPPLGTRIVVSRDLVAGDQHRIETLVAGCAAPTEGRVFRQDPASRYNVSAWPYALEPRADSKAILLDDYADDVSLQGLDLPAAGAQQFLAGTLVKLTGTPTARPNPLVLAPPAIDPGDSFSYSCRTNSFAAVNAYHHCDCAFRLAGHFGCDDTSYFAADQFPVDVSHRGPMVLRRPPTDHVPYTDQQVYTVNAQVLQDAGLGDGGEDRSFRVLEMRFALGDYADPKSGSEGGTPFAGIGDALGSACDPRWAWHEFCHALVVAATGSLELSFAHSAGDALAAILSDPKSALADGPLRGLTFPWVWQPLRWHSRHAEDGWAWYGTVNNNGTYPPPLDPDGYVAEEVLSSTLFRLYQAVGGDAWSAGAHDLGTRERAALTVASRIMRAIGLLGPDQWTPSTPGIFATAMMDADASEVLASDLIPGGALRKVIRWAFEKQGLYAGADRPWNKAGLHEPIDLYFEDGRSGEYPWRNSLEASASALWVQPPGGQQDPVPGQVNTVHLTVGNRGSGAPAAAVPQMSVRVYARSGTAAEVATWDIGAWTLVTPAGSTAGAPPVGQTTQLGPYSWTPVAGAEAHALIAIVDVPGDRSLLSQTSVLPIVSGPVAVQDVVRFDNNLAYRHWS